MAKDFQMKSLFNLFQKNPCLSAQSALSVFKKSSLSLNIQNSTLPLFTIMTFATFLRDLRAIFHFDNRWLLLLERFAELVFKRPLALSIYRKAGMEILMDKSAGDQSGARYAITSRMYRQFLPHIKKIFLEKTGRKEVIVWDIGANVGGFSLMLALEGVAIERLVAVEMHPRTFIRLRQNLEQNLRLNTEQLFCLNVAAGNREETLELSLSRGNTGDSIIAGHLTPQADSSNYSIQLLTLDSIYARHFEHTIVDICKMDIEGAEYEIILGEHQTSLARVRFLLIEIHPHPDHQAETLLDALRMLGFARVRVNPRSPEEVFLFENTQL
jgi:FkbM family methyltransferase